MILDRAACLDWCFPNLVENITRGKVAEYIVAVALGIEDASRVEWEYADLNYAGKLIEVKSSAYLQAWKQNRPAVVRFDIAKRGWNAKTGDWVETVAPKRFADVYVFCLFAEQDAHRDNPLDTDQWQFFVLSRTAIDARFGDQKSVGLAGLSAVARPPLCKGYRTGFAQSDGRPTDCVQTEDRGE